MSTNEELTHEEIWDDSALLNSWNQAFEEYKKYHSIAARGEKVDPTKIQGRKVGDSEPVKTNPLNGGQAGGAPLNFSADAATIAPSAPSTSVPQAPPGLATMPSALIGSTQDENLKNIMMSWYYAGYYTGLYEGQQKAYASMQESG